MTEFIVVLLSVLYLLVQGVTCFEKYNITTIVGGATQGVNDGVLANQALLNLPNGLVLANSGELMIVDSGNRRIRKIDVNGYISTFAGTGISGYSGDGGLAIYATFNYPETIIQLKSSKAFLIADTFNHAIRKIDTYGYITTIAGTGTAGYNSDNIGATKAQLNEPMGVAEMHNGNIIISDTRNNRIRMINITTGIISTIAGNGNAGYNGDGIQATSARITFPSNLLCTSDGTIYFSDYGGNRIRRIFPNGTIDTVVGIGPWGSEGTGGFNGDGRLASNTQINGVWDFDFLGTGELIFVDTYNQRVRMVLNNGTVVTIAGTGEAVSWNVVKFNGDNNDATLSQLSYPTAITIAPNQDIYIADEGNNRIRRMSSLNRCNGILKSEPNVCNGKGVCVSTNNCTCNSGWQGSTYCDVFSCDGLSNCKNHGTCVSNNTCSCNSGWTGSDCSEFSGKYPHQLWYQDMSFNFTVMDPYENYKTIGYGYTSKTESGGVWNLTSAFYFGGDFYIYANGKMMSSSSFSNVDFNVRRYVHQSLNGSQFVCIDQYSLLSDNQFQIVLQGAVAIERSSMDSKVANKPYIVDCLDGYIWKYLFIDNYYLICMTANHDWQIIGQDVVLKTDQILPFYNHTKVVGILQHVPDINFCEIARNEPINSLATEWYLPNNKLYSKPHCIFLHGVGNDGCLISGQSKNGCVQDTFPDYWGNVHSYVEDYCQTVKFYNTETKTRGWTDTSLQREYCNFALNASASTGQLIRNTVIFTHSMGNLVLSAAITNGLCDIDSTSSFWYSVQGPWKGAVITNFLGPLCSGNGLSIGLAATNSFLKKVVSQKGYCDFTYTPPVYPAYNTMIPEADGGVSFTKIIETGKRKISGMMCGRFSPLYSQTTPNLSLLFQYVISWISYNINSWPSGNISIGTLNMVVRVLDTLIGIKITSLGQNYANGDGMVPYDSCTAVLPSHKNMINHYSEEFYYGSIDHQSGTCSNGFSVKQKSCLWYKYMMQKATKTYVVSEANHFTKLKYSIYIVFIVVVVTI